MKAFRISSLLTCSAVALALVSAAPAALADSYTVSAQPTNFSGTSLDVAQFNSSLGTLTSVDITLSGFGTTDITATETAGIPTSVTELYTDVALQLTDPNVNLTLDQSLTGQPLVDGSPISSFNPLSIAAYGTYNSGSLNLAGTAAYDLGITDDLSGYVGNGDLVFYLAGIANTTESFSGGNLNTSQTTDAGAHITVTYNYTAPPPPSVVPEPGTLVLFGTGLLIMAGLVRRKFHQSR